MPIAHSSNTQQSFQPGSEVDSVLQKQRPPAGKEAAGIWRTISFHVDGAGPSPESPNSGLEGNRGRVGSQPLKALSPE